MFKNMQLSRDTNYCFCCHCLKNIAHVVINYDRPECSGESTLQKLNDRVTRLLHCLGPREASRVILANKIEELEARIGRISVALARRCQNDARCRIISESLNGAKVGIKSWSGKIKWHDEVGEALCYDGTFHGWQDLGFNGPCDNIVPGARVPLVLRRVLCSVSFSVGLLIHWGYSLVSGYTTLHREYLDLCVKIKNHYWRTRDVVFKAIVNELTFNSCVGITFQQARKINYSRLTRARVAP